MTLAELTEAWNALRNAALGQGTAPKVSAALAKEVGDTYDAWRAYYTDRFGGGMPIADWLPSVTADGWVSKLRALEKRVRGEGITNFKTLPLSPLEEAISIAKTIGVTVLAVGVPLGLVLLFGRRGAR
jgi:hypothetical protein